MASSNGIAATSTPSDHNQEQLIVADSFRVQDHDGVAAARGFSRHLDRFRASVAEALRLAEVATDERSYCSEALEPFLAGAPALISAYGNGFPRLELWLNDAGETRFDLALRPLPQLATTIDMRSASVIATPDAHVKGPNIPSYARLNAAFGAEALLTSVDSSGSTHAVREGATTSLVFWRDETPESGHVIAAADRVASVTEAALSRFAESQHRPLLPATVTVEQLRRCEVWAVNALHGIRPVAHIDGEPLPAFDPARLAVFQDALEATWEPVAS